MRLYVLCGINIYEAGERPNLKMYYEKPTLEELKNRFGYDDSITNDTLSPLLDNMPVEIGDYEYELIYFDLDDKKLLSNIDIDMKILTYTDRMDLGCSIENVIIDNTITEDMIDAQIISDIKDVYEIDEYQNEEEAVKELLKGCSVWLNNYNGVFEWHTINTKSINKTEE